jgi:hypothetical protein
MAYADLLKDPRWQKKRLEILQNVSTIYRVSAYAQAVEAQVNHASGQAVRVYSLDHARGITDAFTEYQLYEFFVTMGDVIKRREGPTIDAASLAKDASDAMDAAMKKWAATGYPE